MKREIISQGVSDISTRYIQEAADYQFEGKSAKRYKKYFGKYMIAAVLVLGIIVCGIAFFVPSRSSVITAYASGTDEKITAAGAVIHTGTISNTGEMKGKPLMFYLVGEDIATVRFSCKNQQIYFMDWTEKREEYGNAQNFTVVYGEDESEYYYLTLDWVPDGIIRELADNKDSTIAELSYELREDTIVMEITFGNGKKETKALLVSLQDDGTFFASFDDYEIKDSDAFVKRPDSQALPRENMHLEEGGQLPQDDMSSEKGEQVVGDDKQVDDKPEQMDAGTAVLTAEQIDAAKQAALAYYKGTVFSVNTIVYFEGELPYGDEEGDCAFTVNVSKGGVVQEPDRTITLRMESGEWKVVNEGY